MPTQIETFPVAELFASVNGEGLHAGQFSTFIRFVGCNLRCSYCDTQWACQKDCPSTEMTCQELTEKVLAEGTPCVTITGGEPLLQPLLPKLIKKLVEDTSCFVEIETNGSCDLSELAKLRTEIESEGHARRIGFTMDWKLPSSEMEDAMLESNLNLLDADDCLKFVAGSFKDLHAAHALISKHQLIEKCPLVFSPVFGKINPAEIVEFLGSNNLKQARIQVQLHKVIWPNVERGV